MNENLKQMLNKLQNYIVSELESDNVLLIFDNEAELLKYKRKHEYMCPNKLLTTIDNLLYSHFLDGLRFKRYCFVERKVNKWN